MTGTHRYHGRDFTHDDIDLIRRLCADPAYPTRAAIARAVCDALGWHRIDGRRKDMAARVALPVWLAADPCRAGRQGLACRGEPRRQGHGRARA